ncbi:MAG: peptidyl-prolyl cis-trans isomerase [Frankiales bacterium]|nr:peptidyl-prolyl cis-trans isomerase [Frankiales bacterium]
MASSKDRERELARQRYQRQLERRAAAQARGRQRLLIGLTVFAVVAVIAVVAIIAALGTKSNNSTASAGAAGSSGAAGSAAGGSAAASASPSAAASAAVAANPSPTISGGAPLKCTTPPAKPAKPLSFKAEPAMTIDPTASYVATITTNCGVIKADLYAAKAPHTVNSFAFLASKGYFTDVPCHRLTTSGIYVLQCGDPTGTGSGGPGYSFKDENLTGATYGPGVLAMANSGANTNGSQFFINYKTSPLPASYTPFGKITQGLDIVAAIGAKGASGGSGDGAPVQPVSILSFTVTKA